MEKKQVFSIWYFVAAFLLIALLQDHLAPRHANNLPYSDFKALLRAGKISDVAIAENLVSGTLTIDGGEVPVSKETAERLAKLDKGPHPFSAVRVNDPALVEELEAAETRPLWSFLPSGAF